MKFKFIFPSEMSGWSFADIPWTWWTGGGMEFMDG